MKRIKLKGDELIEWNRLRGRANGAVSRAVKAGTLPNLKESQVACSDCGGRASVYDHRDYNKPLEVEPLCHGCNIKRGTILPTVEISQKFTGCLSCGSRNVMFRRKTSTLWCRRCGHEQKAKAA